MRQPDRLQGIVERLSANGGLGVSELAREFDVSTSTIRRDLLLLERQRLLTRTHGGAVPEGVLYELPLRYKAARHQEEKRRIAAAAVALVSDGSAIGLTGGTTTTEVGRMLVERQRLTIVTNALNIAAEMALRRDVRLIVTGGVVRNESYELVGPLAETSLAGLNLDVAFIGVDGISPVAGCTTHHDVEAHTNRTLIRHANRVVVVADSSKIGRVAFAQICPLEAVDQLITDAQGEAAALAALRDADLDVETV
jgi:DeoR family transcriptional regulator, aga operon transcriptional repressor